VSTAAPIGSPSSLRRGSSGTAHYVLRRGAFEQEHRAATVPSG
jgi:hypothetical protein